MDFGFKCSFSDTCVSFSDTFGIVKFGRFL